MEDARSWAASLLSVLRREAASEPSQLLLTAPRDRRTSSQPLAREDLRPREEARASGFRGWRSPPALLSGALSRRRRCRTSVLWATEARERSRAPAGLGRRGHVTPPLRPRPRLRQVFCACEESWLCCAYTQGRLPEQRQPRVPGARRQVRGWRATSVPLPSRRGRDFARWAPKSRKS